MNISILGAGAWGTALAHSLACYHPAHPEVVLWGRSADLMTQLAQTRMNAHYLPSITLSAKLNFATDLTAAFDHVFATKVDAQMPENLLIIATALSGLPAMCEALAAYFSTHPSIAFPHAVFLSKGVQVHQQTTEGRLFDFPQDIAERILGKSVAVGLLSGPSFAQEVAQGLPCALVAASTDSALQRLMVLSCHGGNLRVYPSNDVIGVAIGGAIKNILAIATGICDGLSLGLNARAALMTRGLAEILRLNRALGGKDETVMGLAGMGDLLLTCTGDLSRNRRVGLLLAQGFTLDKILERLGHVAEGVRCAPAVWKMAQDLQINMPIVEQVNRVLFEGISPKDAVAYLMQRTLPSAVS